VAVWDGAACLEEDLAPHGDEALMAAESPACTVDVKTKQPHRCRRNCEQVGLQLSLARGLPPYRLNLDPVRVDQLPDAVIQ